ncbi:MAG: (2Fe-2S) ferredoxin domain-containing protein [Bacteroidota bacterium]
MLYRKHIFICTNQRKAGERVSCGETHGMELVAAFKKLIKDHGIHTEVRAQRTGCFDICEQGPTVAVYPEGVFYGKVQIADVQEIFEQHILNGLPVERLRLNFEKKS